MFLHLSRSDLVVFKGDLNHRKLTYDCAAPASTPFDVAIGSMASAAGSPVIASLRTIKSDVVVGLGFDGDETAAKLDKDEPGWRISGKYVSLVHRCEALSDGLSYRCLGCRSCFDGSPRRTSSFHLDICMICAPQLARILEYLDLNSLYFL